MRPVFLTALFVLMLLLLPFLARVIKGPSVFDRVAALNGLGTIVPAMLVLIGQLYGAVGLYVDIALALFLLNLFTTLLIAHYVRREREGDA